MKIHTLTIIVFSILLVVLGDRLIVQRTLNGPTEEFTIRGDTLNYISMSEGKIADVGVPYRYRIFVPFLTRLLPFSALLNLKIITYVSLFLFYIFALLSCRRIGFNHVSSFAGLFIVYSSCWHLYNYHNPYLADGFGLMVFSLLLLSFLKRSFIIYCVTAIVGILAREATLFLTPLWLTTKEWRKGTMAIVVALIAFIIPRVLLSSNTTLSATVIGHLSCISSGQLTYYLAMSVLAWRSIWILAFFGIILFPIRWFWPFLTASVLLFIGAFFVSLFGGDIGREFSILSPVMIISCAQLFSVLSKKSAFLTIFLLLTFVAQLFSGIPTIITPRDSWIFSSYLPRILLFGVQILISICIAIIIRTELRRGLKEKIYAITIK